MCLCMGVAYTVSIIDLTRLFSLTYKIPINIASCICGVSFWHQAKPTKGCQYDQYTIIHVIMMNFNVSKLIF